MAVTPLIQSLFFVDEVESDADGKTNLKGVFDCLTILAGQKFYTEGCCIYFALREVHKRIAVKVSCTDLSGMTVIYQREPIVDASGPLETVVVCMQANRIPVPHAGVYVWDVSYNNVSIGSTRVTAIVGDSQPPA